MAGKWTIGNGPHVPWMIMGVPLVGGWLLLTLITLDPWGAARGLLFGMLSGLPVLLVLLTSRRPPADDDDDGMTDAEREEAKALFMRKYGEWVGNRGECDSPYFERY